MPLEVARLLLAKHDGTPFGDLLWTAATTGMRQAEVAGIFTPNVRLAGRRLWVGNQLSRALDRTYKDAGPKYKSQRWVPIYSKLAARWMPLDSGEEGYWFVDYDQRNYGGPWQVRKMSVVLSRSWDELCAAHPELPKRKPRQGWHAFRHLYSNLLDRGGVRETVRTYVMGHKEKGVSRAVYLEIEDSDLDVIDPIIDAAFGDLLPAPLSVGTPVQFS
jgi:integrase